MAIINRTKDAVLAESFEECTTMWQQLRGMMFRKEVVPLVFSFPSERRVNLHSYFCPGNMDLVFLDENWVVVEVQADWPPRQKYRPERRCMFLLELPAETVWRTNTEAGDIVHIVRN